MKRFRNSGRTSGVRIELAPFVDIVLVLLIFFVVATSLSVHQKGLQVKLPSASTGTDNSKGIVLSVDASEHLLINDMPTTMQTLSADIALLVKADPKTHVIIHADQVVPYHVVVEVLDHVRLGGCFDVVLEAHDTKQPHA
ncbi:MAG: biopolymer transporter ExbD [Candidatus Margulisbacteria bacterium]|nr:biopolymer transporter ExbD [Candidatus Margulisiibacteriota bacterium]